VTDALPPRTTVLDYARPKGSAATELVVRVSPEGVLLRVSKPLWLAELAKGFFYLVGVLSTGAAIAIAVWPERRAFAAGFNPLALVCTMIAAVIWGSFAVHLIRTSRTLVRMLRRDPGVGTRFFPAADREPAWGVDPVRSVELQREPMQATLWRPHVLRITTRRGLHFNLLRGRPVEELEAVAEELRRLLRLDAAPAKGFPVVPIGERM
jgi:hypothetical protein